MEGDAGAGELYSQWGVDALDATDSLRGNDTMNGGRDPTSAVGTEATRRGAACRALAHTRGLLR